MNISDHISPPVKILIVDDHALIRKGVMAILNDHNKSWQLYEAEDGVKAILKARDINPEIILLDYHMPKLDGVKAATIISQARPESKIIMVSMDMSPEIVIEMIDAGVAGIVSKHSQDYELIEAIGNVQNGKRHLSEPVSKIVTQDILAKKKSKRSPGKGTGKLLTERETEILKLTVKGSSSQTIARILSISIRTVENHKATIFKKCNVNSTLQLIKVAIKLNLISQ